MTLERVTPGKPGGAPRSSEEMQERNREMRDLRHLGLTLQEIGDRYDLTRERVRQIVGDVPMLRGRESCDPLTLEHKKMIRELMDHHGVRQCELGVSGFGRYNSGGAKNIASHLRTGPCRDLFGEIVDILMAAAYLDGATISELSEIFGDQSPGILTRLRGKGYNLPHRKSGTHWNISEGDTE